MGEKKWKEYEAEKEARKRKAEHVEKKEEDDAKESETKEGEAKEGETKEGETKEEEKKEEEPEEEKAVELTEEEKKINFRKLATPDIVDADLAKSFANYSVPAKEEGFDEIRYVWSSEKVAAEKLREWLLEKKR